MKTGLSLILALVFSVTVSADPQIDPATLRQTLLNGNTAIMMELNRIHQAKDQVNIARGQLLPSINATTIIAAAAGPTFLLASIDVLLPFLIPSNWFNYSKAKEMYEAEKASYRLLQLNTFASAYSLYHTVLSDSTLLVALEEEYSEVAQIQELLDETSKRLGTVSVEDLNRAHAATAQAEIRVMKLRQLVTQERAQLRFALGLPLSSNFTIASAPLEQSPWESKTVAETVGQALKLSPEYAQLLLLEKAGEKDRWSKRFGFVTAASAGASATGVGTPNQQSVAFNKLTAKESFNIGFAYLPSIALTNDNINEIKIRQAELKLELTRILESTLGALAQAQKQYNAAVYAETKTTEIFENRMNMFKLGVGTLYMALEAQTQMAEARMETTRAIANLNLLRITLHRTMVTDQFAQITGCRPTSEPATVGFFKGLFSSQSSQRVDVDKYCRPDDSK